MIHESTSSWEYEIIFSLFTVWREAIELFMIASMVKWVLFHHIHKLANAKCKNNYFFTISNIGLCFVLHISTFKPAPTRNRRTPNNHSIYCEFAKRWRFLIPRWRKNKDLFFSSLEWMIINCLRTKTFLKLRWSMNC